MMSKQDAIAPASEAGPAPKRIVVAFGFWVFLLSDIVMFSALFAAYAVLVRATAGGPTGAAAVQSSQRRDPDRLSSYLKLHMRDDVAGGHARRQRLNTYMFALVTFVLGAAFLYLEVHEFASMIARGATPQRSAFLSAFFTVVGCHGLHVTAGLIWLAVMMAQVAFKGFRPSVDRRLLCFALFWHALDIIWVWLFTAVYLMGFASMTDTRYDRAPGEISTTAEAQRLTLSDFGIYTVGFVLAVILTAISFWVANTSLLWAPGIAMGLVVLAIAQMGVHLVFFLHITTGPDNTNNVLALAFGMLIVFLVVVGSLWIMTNLNDNLMPSPDLMNLHMQH